MRHWMISTALCLMACSCAAAEGPPIPAGPVMPADVDVPAKLSPASTMEQILDALDARGQGLKDFSADVAQNEKDAVSGDSVTRLGRAWYQAKGEGDARIRILLDAKKVGDQLDNQDKIEYILDNGWLTDRNYKKKAQIDRQVLKPGQKLNLLKLGEGPFPLPVGQPRGEVLKQFDVKKIDAAADDPAGSVHLKLIPKAGMQFERRFKSMDVWVETVSNFPTRIQTVNMPRGFTVTTWDLTKIQVNTGLTDKDFPVEQPPADWSHRSEMME